MQHSVNSSRSLKFKLVALTMGITFTLGLVATGILTYLVRTSEKSISDTFGAYAQNLSDAVSTQFYERYGDVQAFALNPNLQASSRQLIVETLDKYAATYGIYDLIMVVDAKGNLVAVNDKSPAGKELAVKSLYAKNFADADWFKAALAGKTTDEKAKGLSGTYFEDLNVDPYVNEAYGEKRLANSFSTPLVDARGHVIGVISNRANASWVTTAFHDIVETMREMDFRGAQALLVDHSGKLMFEYISDPTEKTLLPPKFDFDVLLKYVIAGKGNASVDNAISGKSGTAFTHNSRTGREQIAGYTPVHGDKFVQSIGWSVIVRDDKAEVFATLKTAEQVFYVGFFLVMALACVASYYFSASLSRRLSGMAGQLADGSSEVSAASRQISQSASSLSESSTEQAAAIQQTAASIDQVSAMVKKSAENASLSQKASTTSREAAEQGQQAVQAMIQSINDISRSNTDIMGQVEAGNHKIAEIVRVIAEIESKTKVINDIVFQTKLLSFNASVEAARAGEQGKGFAVVAEEVGNLAQMSGNAAKEISSMLESSIQKVQGIVNDTKSSVEKLIVDSRQKVEAGTQVAQRCGTALTQILSAVQQVDGMVAEIASASHEQSQGVTEINKAVNQLDQATQANTGTAQSTAQASEQLDGQARQLKQMVTDLFELINGRGSKRPSDVAVPHHAAPARREPTVAAKTRSNSPAPVVSIHRASEKQVRGEPAVARPARATAVAAGGGGAPTPSRDDPRFEDV